MRLSIVYEDNHLLAAAKPAGVATMGAAAGEPTFVEAAKAYLREKHQKPGNVYLGVVSRLDAPVTGLLLLARTSKAAGRLTEAFRTRRVEKRYLATVEGDAGPPGDEQSFVHYLRKDDRNQRMHTTHAEAPDAKRAELTYRVLLREGTRSLLEVRPLTGRKHQIRVQLAKVGLPIVGDRKYGASTAYEPGIGLHSWRLGLEHPVRREPLHLEAAPPTRWGGWAAGSLSEALANALDGD